MNTKKTEWASIRIERKIAEWLRQRARESRRTLTAELAIILEQVKAEENCEKTGPT